jgi:peptidoglycan/xylan/chitin deacetylase (PgdA/CDA1 family)
MKRITLFTFGIALLSSISLGTGHAAPPPGGDKPPIRVCLTFDDGPGVAAGQTSKVLDVLRQHNAPAAFFCVGKNLTSTAGKALARRSVDQGCLVCNHTTNHPICTQITPEAFRNEVVTCQNAIEAATGQSNKFFRFPGGAGTTAQKAILTELGLTPVGWKCDSQDWCYAYYRNKGSKKYLVSQGVPAAFHENYVGYVVDHVVKNGGGILLNHDIHATTVADLDKVLTQLEAKGAKFVSLKDYLGQ